MVSNAYISKRSKGFTLIELLVVIVVMGILVGIVYVSYSGFNNKSKKSSYEGTANQVKMDVGEFFTDNGYYPTSKSNVSSYMTSIGAAKSLVTEFNTSPYQYHPYKTSNHESCSTNTCQYYEIIVPKSNWSGGSSESDLKITP